MEAVHIFLFASLVIIALMCFGWAKCEGRARMMAWYLRRTDQQDKFLEFVMDKQRLSTKESIAAKYFDDFGY